MTNTTPPQHTPVNQPGPSANEVDAHVKLEAANTRRPHWVHVAIDLADGATLELTVPATGGGIAGYFPATPNEQPALWIVKDGQRRRAKLGPLLASTRGPK